MLVKGHSGFEIELTNASTLRKSARGPQAERLHRQIQKQILFQKEARFDRILTPTILHSEHGVDCFRADMEFIAADDFVEYLLEAGRRELDDFLGVLVHFIRQNLALSHEADVSGPIRQKLAELKAKGIPSRYIEVALELSSNPVLIPVGPCHGDLTLSNMLFKGSQLYLIDFLDGFIDSPLQDIAKIRQDTFFCWSLHLYTSEFDATKIRLALAYLDRGIESTFARDAWYRNHYDLLQLVNLMRILPYCQGAASTQIVTGALDRLLALRQPEKT